MDRESIEILNRTEICKRDAHFRAMGAFFLGIICGMVILLIGFAVGKNN